MDLIELALNPRKAAQRFSPFTNKLPPGMGRKLEYYFGDYASTDPGELALYSRDASTPPGMMKLLLKRDAWAVVRPQIRGDLQEIVKFANANGVPVVPRGSGTSGYGGAVPTEGGVVVDMRDFRRVIAVDAKGLTARVEAGITFADLELQLRKHGLALRQYPTSYYGATVAGWVAAGGGGVGSAKYGPFKNDVLEVTLVQPDGAVAVVTGEDLDLANEAWGTTGFIVEVLLKVRKDNPVVPFIAVFGDLEKTAHAVKRIGRELGAYSVHVHPPEYAELVNEAARTTVLPKNKWSVLVALEDAGATQPVELLKGIVTSAGGELAADKDARKAWDARFNHLNLKRLGPSVVVSEVVHPADQFREAYTAAMEATRMERQCVWAIAISPRDLDLIYYGLEDERRPTYPAALGNSLAVIDAVREKAHGRPYSTGVLQVNEADRYFNGVRKGPPARKLLGGLVGGVSGGVGAALVMLLAAAAGAESAVNVLEKLSLGSGSWILGALAFTLVLALLGLAGGVVLQPGDRVFSFVLAQAWAGLLFLLLWIGPMIASGVTIPLSWGSLLVGILALGPFATALGLVGGRIAYPMDGVLGKIRKFRDETDPKDVFNPGPVVGGRTRVMPLPVRDLSLQLALAAPMIKLQRGMFEYRGGEKADPSSLAVAKAVGRVNAGDLAEVDYDVTTCLFCAACNHVAPERPAAHLESQLPRGRVQLAKALLEGRIEPTAEMHRKAAANPLAFAPDAICPTAIPIARATDLLLGACVDALGPLPEHAPLAANAEKEGNVLGRPKDQRGKWAAIAWAPDARTLYFADDAASYESPEIAVAAANVVINAGVPLHYLGKAERHSGATLVETGQRAAAKSLVVPMLEEMAKRNVDAIVTPDANAARTIRLDWPTFARGEGGLAVPPVQHTTAAIADLLKQKRMEIAEPWAETVAYHAPEALSGAERAAGIDVLKALGAKVVDAPHADCGHGRALDKLNPALAGAITETALKAYAATGAKVIVTSSPGCYATLKTMAKKAKAGVEVVDLHEAVAKRMKLKEGGGAVAVVVAAPAVEEKPKEPEIPPDHYRVEFAKEGVVLAVHKNRNVLEAGEEAGLELPSSCRAGSCDTCCARWEGTAPDQSAGAALSAEQQKAFVLTCVARPKGPVTIWSDERPK